MNYYTSKSRMGGHLDDGEPDQEHPIFSYSIGLSCVFLIGGRTKDQSPLAVRLDSGDFCVMAGESRKCFHGVPRVIPGSFKTGNLGDLGEQILKGKYKGKESIIGGGEADKQKVGANIEKGEHLTEVEDEKIVKGEGNLVIEKGKGVQMAHNQDEINEEVPAEIRAVFNNSLQQTLNYLSENRINMNFRQVLFDKTQVLNKLE